MPDVTLNKKEIEILILFKQGWPDREVRACLNISQLELTTHLSSIYDRLGIDSAASAVKVAEKLGLI